MSPRHLSHIWEFKEKSDVWLIEICKECGCTREIDYREEPSHRLITLVYHPDGNQVWREDSAPSCSAIRLDEALV